jgi:hypothetical protein
MASEEEELARRELLKKRLAFKGASPTDRRELVFERLKTIPPRVPMQEHMDPLELQRRQAELLRRTS